MFAWESAENFITYKYEIIDKDKAINNNDFNLYYSVNEDEVINPSESVTCPKPMRAYNASAYKCAKINNLNMHAMTMKEWLKEFLIIEM